MSIIVILTITTITITIISTWLGKRQKTVSKLVICMAKVCVKMSPVVNSWARAHWAPSITSWASCCYNCYIYILLYITIYYYILLYMTIYDYIWLYITIYYYIWRYITIYYYIWLYITIYITIYDYILLYITILIYIWNILNYIWNHIDLYYYITILLKRGKPGISEIPGFTKDSPWPRRCRNARNADLHPPWFLVVFNMWKGIIKIVNS